MWGDLNNQYWIKLNFFLAAPPLSNRCVFSRVKRPLEGSAFIQTGRAKMAATQRKRKREIQEENSEMHQVFQHQKVVAELKRRKVEGLHGGHIRKVNFAL